MTRWFLEKPQDMAAWLDQRPADGEDVVVHINTWNVMYQNREGSLGDLQAMMRISPPTSSLPDRVADDLVKVWSRPGERAAAEAWLRTVEDVEVRDVAWSKLAAHVAVDDPAAAQAMLPEIGDAGERRSASSSIAAAIAQRDPQAALQFAATLPDEESASTARRSALATWALRDPKAAFSAVRESGAPFEDVDALQWKLGRDRPAEALEAAPLLPPDSRVAFTTSVFSDWWSSRPLEAQKWLQSDQAAGLSAAELESLQRVMQPRVRQDTSSGWSTTINGRRVRYSF